MSLLRYLVARIRSDHDAALRFEIAFAAAFVAFVVGTGCRVGLFSDIPPSPRTEARP
jgi:hypothetical protein